MNTAEQLERAFGLRRPQLSPLSKWKMFGAIHEMSADRLSAWLKMEQDDKVEELIDTLSESRAYRMPLTKVIEQNIIWGDDHEHS